MFAHAAAGFLEPARPEFPLAAAVVSGGHTNLYLVKSPLEFELLGQTRDDAAGEAFDKVAKLLGLGYPGGRAIDELAALGDPKRFDLPRPMQGRGLDFSFSGLKTAVLNLWQDLGRENISRTDLIDLASSFQAAAVDVLVQKIAVLLKKVKARTLILAGGVAANSSLRKEATGLAERTGVQFILPNPSLCTDNAAMVAALGYHHLLTDRRLDLAADAFSRWDRAA